ncbi:helix-turn-helix domain-containing protein [Actinoallomurus spadix]|uniref:Helix-turn-helix transcriptional regulator n=1 Tax=Actinoallomurus spadix TaxID=79912 RepID=A0ABP3HCN1_9ACTN|nr:helix-turn-helix domain-containing protein [Actinoallomurus spadix]
MVTGPLAGGVADSALLAYRQAGPTVLRMLVGAQLRRLREASGLTCQSAGAAIQASHSKISRLELGRRGFKQRDLEELLTLYGVDGGAERATLLELAELATAPPWWREYADVVPRWFEDYLGLEQAASVIRTYEVQFVPGLLQTPDYARAVIRLAHRDQPEAVIDRRVGLRMKRQRLLLQRPNPPKLWAVIDEAALRRPIGGAATMRAQLRHLLEIAELPNVTVEVMPFSAGGHAAAGGPITLLRFPEDDIPDVVYLEQLTNAVYATKTADVDYYWHVLNRVVIEAEPPSASLKILQRILRET